MIIPSRDNHPVLAKCITSIFKISTYQNFELIVIDNGSTEIETRNYLEQLQSRDRVKVIRHEAPFNFSELCNLGVSVSSGKLLLFLNDDTEVLTPDWLERMGGYAQLKHIGAVGAKLLYPGGKEVQHAGVLNLANGPDHALLRIPADSPGYYMRNLLEYNWLAVTGACLMISRDKFDQLSGFNEELPVAYNDIDLCMRLVEAGFFNIVCPPVKLIHYESLSRGNDHQNSEKLDRLHREREHLYSLHPQYRGKDPFFSSNLHPNGSHFELPA
jgi:GT2 family glycosyltransferase